MKSIVKLNSAFILLIFFIVSRLILNNVFNLRFEYDWIFQMWHFIDIALLKNKMFESIIYFHYQPPIFNLILALIHKQNILDPSLILRIIFYGFTYLIGLIIFKSSEQLAPKKYLPYFLVFLFFLFPETIIYENWPIYTWSSSFLLIVGFFFLGRYNKTGKEFNLFLFFLSQLFLILTRSAFHPIFFISLFLIILLFYRNKKAEIIKNFLPSFLLLMLVALKNFYLFGFFGVGSGLGFSLYKIAPKEINKTPVENLIKIDPLFKIVPVKSVSTYGFTSNQVSEKFKNIEILNNEFKSTLENFSEEYSVNLGNYHYLEIAKIYQKNAINIIKKFPLKYLSRVIRGTIMYFKPTWDHGFGVSYNAENLKKYINIFTLHNLRLKIEGYLIKSEKPWPLNTLIPYSSYIFIPILYFLIIFYLFKLKFISPDQPEYFFIIFTVVYLTFVSNLVELAENDRYRVMIDPLVYMAGCHVFLVLLGRNNIKKNKNSSN